MIRNVVLLAGAAMLLSQIPSWLHLTGDTATIDHATVSSITPPSAAAPQPISGGAHKITLPANSAGHFVGEFRLNGKPVTGLIDTGATFVAVNESTARSIGFTGNGLDYRYAVSTANGPAEAAHVTLSSVSIGGVTASQVEAFVLKDKSLNGTLIGMSFLKKLRSYSADSSGLTLAN